MVKRIKQILKTLERLVITQDQLLPLWLYEESPVLILIKERDLAPC